MPRLEDIKNVTDYEKQLYGMFDEDFLEYATSPEMNDLYKNFSEADKTAFLIRAMMVGDRPDSFFNDLKYNRNNMYSDGPQEVRAITDANNDSVDYPDPPRKIQYDVYRAILYSDQNELRQLASKTTKKMSASDIIESYDKLRDVFTAHLRVPVLEDLSDEEEAEIKDAAKKERDTFLKSLGFESYDEEEFDGKEYDGEEKTDSEEHVYIPLKDKPVDINAVEDEAAKEEFTVADKNGVYNVVIRPLKEGEARETLLNGYDLEETPVEEKRNMLFSYALQGMGKSAITDALNLIQANEQYRNLFDLCVHAMDSKEVIENKDLIQNAIFSGGPVNNDSYRLYSKADALIRRKKIENPILKKEEDDESEELVDVDESQEDLGIKILENAGNDSVIKKDDIDIYDKKFDIDTYHVRPEAEKGDLPDKMRNANEWIDRIKEAYDGDAYRADKAAARILAARILVDSERGVLKSLKKPVMGSEIDDLSKKLLENETFRNFMDSLDVDEKRDLLQQRGHGGALEDRFKGYILKLKAGKLHNDRILDRFMPKAYQRIEELQRQAAKRGENESIYKEAAEVMLIRAMIGVGRNQPDKLSAKIPTFSNLAKEVEELGTYHPTFIIACGMERTIKDFQDGHGGLMIENMYKSGVGSNEYTAVTRDFRTYCTADYRYGKLQERAKNVLNNLKQSINKKEDSLDTYEACMEAKEVLAEAVVMAMTMARDDHRNKEISPTLKTIQEGTEVIKKEETFNSELFPKGNPSEFYQQLKAFAEAGNPKDYADNLYNNLRDVYLINHPEARKRISKHQQKENTVNSETENTVNSETGKTVKPGNGKEIKHK